MAKISRNCNDNKGTVHFEDAIAMTGFGIFNILILLIVGGCLMCVIIETMSMMFIIPAAQCDLNLTLSTKGLLSSISFVGVMCSSHLWGYIADTRGRKKAMMFSMYISFVMSLISSLIPHAWLFIIFRYLNGFFIGGSSAVIYAFIGEFHDYVYRPKVVTWLATFVAIGNMILPGMAWLILPQEWSFHIPLINILFRPWRLLVIIYGLTSLIFATLLLLMPESPKYLLCQDRHDEALAILKKMFVMNTKKSADEFPVSYLVWDEINASISNKSSIFKNMWDQTVPLFVRTNIIKTIMVCMMQFGIFFSQAAVLMWYPEILNKMSHFMQANPNDEVTICQTMKYFQNEDNAAFKTDNTTTVVAPCRDFVNTEVFSISIIIGFSYAMVFLIVGSIINIFGAKNLLIGLQVIGATCGLAAQYVSGFTYIQILIGLFLMGGSAIGITNTIVVDLYPTQIRAMALAISLMFGRFGAVTGTNVIGPLLYNVCDYMFYIFAADCLILIVIVLLLPSASSIKKMIEPIT